MTDQGRREEIRLGRNYCLSVEEPGEALRFLGRLLRRGAPPPCTLVTTIHPRKVAEDHGLQAAEIMWVTDDPPKDIKAVQPSRMKFELTKDLLTFIATKENGVVFIEGVEYLIQVNGFDGVLAFVKQLGDKAGARGHSLIVSINGRSLPEQQFVLFCGRFDRSGGVSEFRVPGEAESEEDLLGSAFQFSLRRPDPAAPERSPTAPEPVKTSAPTAAFGSSTPSPSPSASSTREPSGIPGLDQLIEGGIPTGAAILLQSPVGHERDLFAAQFAIEGLRSSQPVAIMLSSVPPDELRERLRSLGCDPAPLEAAGMLKFVDWYSHRDQRILGIEERGAVTRVSKGLTNLEIALSKIMRQFQGRPARFVADFLTPAIFAQGFDSSKKLAETLRVKFSRQSITSLFLLDKGTHDAQQSAALQQVFDGVIDIEHEKVGNLVERKAAVISMRRTFVRTEYFPLDVSRARGVSLRVIVVEPRTPDESERWVAPEAIPAGGQANAPPAEKRPSVAPASTTPPKRPAQDERPSDVVDGVKESLGNVDRGSNPEITSAVPSVPAEAEPAALEPGAPVASTESTSIVPAIAEPQLDAAIGSQTAPPASVPPVSGIATAGASDATSEQDVVPSTTRTAAEPVARPAAESLPSPAQPAPAQESRAPCPTCSTPMTYVGDYRAWWCARCQKYGALADPQHAAARCPRCQTQMVYDQNRSSWYCQRCTVYPYESPAPGPAADVPAAEPAIQLAVQKVEPQVEEIGRATAGGEKSAVTLEPSSGPAAAPPAPASAAASPETPKCANCGKPLDYIEQYRAWYCHPCQQYGAVAYQ